MVLQLPILSLMLNPLLVKFVIQQLLWPLHVKLEYVVIHLMSQHQHAHPPLSSLQLCLQVMYLAMDPAVQ